MYMACRHIKPNGLRCKSPAMRSHCFCYFHAKLHTRTSNDAARFGPLTLPVLEDPAAIQIAISRIFEAMLNGRIESKLAGQLLYGLQIASQHANHQILDTGVVCNGLDICVGCKYEETCPDFDPANDGKDGGD